MNKSFILNEFFENNFDFENNVFIFDKDDGYTSNFSKQWKEYNSTQIDSINQTNISKDYLIDLLFNNIEILKDKNILEIGCGAGRFTEHLINYCKICVSVDMSGAIFHNIAKDSKKLYLIKSDLNKLIYKKKFDIVICRGVLQHTKNPKKSIVKLFDFKNKKGIVYFDYYKKPKIGIFHPKYLIWRPLIQSFIKYETLELFLKKNIRKLIFFKKIIKRILFNSYFLSDCFIPIWNFREEKYRIKNKLYVQWTILDTLDGIYAKYDYPKTNKEILTILEENNIKLIKTNKSKNYFSAKKY